MSLQGLKPDHSQGCPTKKILRNTINKLILNFTFLSLKTLVGSMKVVIPNVNILSQRLDSLNLTGRPV